jgi:hypothetical protein
LGGCRGGGGSFYSTLGYTERPTERREDPGDKAQYQGKRSHPDLRKMIKEYCGTKEGFVCLTSRN